jgi:uncharacterized membrane-anchored protein
LTNLYSKGKHENFAKLYDDNDQETYGFIELLTLLSFVLVAIFVHILRLIIPWNINMSMENLPVPFLL